MATTPPALLRRGRCFIEPLFGDVWYAMVRFGRWESILDRPTPPVSMHVSHATALWAKASPLPSP